MKTMLLCLIVCVTLSLAAPAGWADEAGPFPTWENGPPSDEGFFPIGVWLQTATPARIAAYRDIGINLYVGQHNGPTEAQLTALHNAGMMAMVSQNDYARTLLAEDSPLLDIVVGWTQQDEPDNAQPADGGGYGPPITPEEIQNRYDTIKSHDTTRPVYLNLGQGVAWDGWIGRGTRTNHPEDYPEYAKGADDSVLLVPLCSPEDYPEYAKGADIVSFDIYPASNDREIQGELWRVGHGTARLREWAADDQPVWAFIETTDISGHGKATPDEVRAMVWMALVNGATGIQYFAHQIGPTFIEAGLLQDAEMTAAVSAINQQIHELAPVLNSASITNGIDVASSNGDMPVDWMLKQQGGAYYLFAVGMRGDDTVGTFDLAGLGVDDTWTVQAVGEDRELQLVDGAFDDAFAGWEVHQYRIVPEPGAAGLLGSALALLATRRLGRAPGG